uniref:ShKT domain-containing protein n=1 Tax=Peromyscus maniculatus bairdii TaxID=230844 RepID=A0A8C8UL03_PERMB
MTLFPLLLFLAANKNFEDLSTTKESVQEEIVNKHNQLRRMVSPPGSDLLKMQWSNDARVNAQRWASQCTYEHSSPDVRTTNIRCGENIFRANYPASWSHVIQTWYDEVNDFKFASDPNPIDASVGHYTQVRKSTLSVNAKVYREKLKVFDVFHFNFSGNTVRRQYIPYSIGKPCGLCPDHCEDGLCTNGCEHEDRFSNCAEVKASVMCEDPIVLKNCKATYYCEGKIH